MLQNQEFGRFRKMIFPIYQCEFRKIIPLIIVFFVISLNYTVVRGVKDMFILKYINAEAIYYIKLLGVLPGVFLLTVLYNNMSRSVSFDRLFNIVVGYFLTIFIVFCFIVMPNTESMRFNSMAEWLINGRHLPNAFANCIRYWHLSLFYIHAEAWGSIVLGVLFWTFTNSFTSSDQARRIYSFLGIGGAVGAITSGILLKSYDIEITLVIAIALIVFMLLIYNALTRDMRINPSLYQIDDQPVKKKEKSKMSFFDSLKMIMKSEYLLLISSLVICYGGFISLFEAVWKAQIRKLIDESGPGILKDIYGNQGIFSGILALLMIFFLASYIMNRSWRFAASVTPAVALLATCFFFFFLYHQNDVNIIPQILAAVASPMVLAVWIGLFNVVFIKSVKYTLFDPTKERVYIPLDEDAKVRCKAAVDGVGSRLGKSLGSLILTIGILPIMESIDKSKSIIFVLLILILVAWLLSINRLNKLFYDLLGKQEKEKNASKKEC